MSRIGDLIAMHCQRGVEFRPLGSVCRVFSGYAFKAELFNSIGIGLPLVRIRDVNTGYSDTYYSGDYDDRFLVDDGDILIGMDGDFRATRWKHGHGLLNQRVCRLQDFSQDMLPGLMFYIVRGELEQIHRGIQGSTVKHLSSRDLEKRRIPVPPLEVQREIVRILDQFTQLEAELEAELEARRLQYGYYRRSIIASVRAPSVRLGELGRWYGGMTPSKSNPRYWDSGDIPWLASMDVNGFASRGIRGRVTPLAMTETSLRLVPATSVAVVMRSNILRRQLPIGLIDVPTTVNQDVRALAPLDGIDAEYVYQVLQTASEEIRSTCVRTDGSMAAVDSPAFFAYEIPVPSLAQQRQIASRLRSFDALVNDLSIGLPAELAARRKQYEYYRDKLLTFQEAAA